MSYCNCLSDIIDTLNSNANLNTKEHEHLPAMCDLALEQLNSIQTMIGQMLLERQQLERIYKLVDDDELNAFQADVITLFGELAV